MRDKLHQVAVFLRWSIIAVLIMPVVLGNLIAVCLCPVLIKILFSFEWRDVGSAAAVLVILCASAFLTVRGFKALNRERPLIAAAWLLIPALIGVTPVALAMLMSYGATWTDAPHKDYWQ